MQYLCSIPTFQLFRKLKPVHVSTKIFNKNAMLTFFNFNIHSRSEHTNTVVNLNDGKNINETVFPLSRKKRHFRHSFWTPADKNFENRLFQIWTQFLPQEKLSQNKISLFFRKCALHIFTIEAVLRSQHGYTAVSGEKKFRRSLEILRLQVCSKNVLGAISRLMRPKNEAVCC